MKKFTLLALAAMIMVPATMSAASWEKTVTSGNEFKTAFNSIGAGAKGETYTIICDWEPGQIENVGTIKPNHVAGSIIIKSNKTEYDKMPCLQVYFNFQKNAVNEEIGSRTSFIIENMHLYGNNSYLIDNRFDVFADTIAIRNCELQDFKRSVLRFDADKGSLIDNKNMLSIDVVDVCYSKFHDIDVSSGDNWQPFRVFFPVNTFNLHDNMFYDMPYAKTLWEARSPNDTPSSINVSNNLVLLGENKVMNEKNGFVVLQLGANVAPGSLIHLHNNIFAGAKAGLLTLHSEESTYTNTRITDAENLVIMMNNNVIDTTSYKCLDSLKVAMEANGNVVIESGTMIFPSNEETTWATAGLFQEPSKSEYNMLKSNAWYTAGYYDADNMIGATYVGPSIAYVDKFPVKASVSVKVEGPKYCEYSIVPEKAQYYVGDEITLFADGHNSAYREFTTFEGWSDGDKNALRTIVLEGDLDLTATFTEKLKAVAAFDFSSVTGKDMDEVKSEVYYNMDPAYQATYHAMNVDTISIDTIDADAKKYVYNMDPEGKVVRGKFPTRADKFAEEDNVALRMAVASRRTVGSIKYVARNYHVVTFNTTGFKGISFSCFVGTDNHASKVQTAEWSVDGEYWFNFANVYLTEPLKWFELKGELPETADDHEKVMVRIIGDVEFSQNIEQDYVIYEPTFIDENTGLFSFDLAKDADIHEYVGNVLVTAASDASGIINVASDKQSDAAAPMYNLMGMKVAKGTKGLLIQNGKKIVVK